MRIFLALFLCLSLLGCETSNSLDPMPASQGLIGTVTALQEGYRCTVDEPNLGRVQAYYDPFPGLPSGRVSLGMRIYLTPCPRGTSQWYIPDCP